MDYIPMNMVPDTFLPGENRYITMIWYLSDVEEGGETIFPYTDSNYSPNKHGYTDELCATKDLTQMVRKQPKKGSAILFYNMAEIGHMDGDQDMKSLHAGCIVKKGEKWAVNFWIHNYMMGQGKGKPTFEEPTPEAHPTQKDILVYVNNAEPAILTVGTDSVLSDLRVIIAEELDEPPVNYYFANKKTGVRIQKKQESIFKAVDFPEGLLLVDTSAKKAAQAWYFYGLP